MESKQLNVSSGTDDATHRSRILTSHIAIRAVHRRTALSIGYLAFFLSGCASLIFEISWSRQIGLLFGHTAQAAAIVIFGYFAGMAVGCAAGARWMRRTHPLMALVVAEFAAAGWACVIPVLIRLSETSTCASWLNSPSLVWQTTARAVFCILLLMPATIALGTTLPMMAAMFSSARWRVAEPVSIKRTTLAYALNTAGALIGVLAATFLLLPFVGVVASSYIAACVAVACGLSAWILLVLDQRLSGSDENWCEPEVSGPPTPSTRPNLSAIPDSIGYSNDPQCHTARRKRLIAAAVSGFGTMSLEVLYIRLFSLIFHNSTYTFGAVVAVFIAALALGAAIVSRHNQTDGVERLVGGVACAGAQLTMFSLLVFAWMTDLDYFSFGHSFASYVGGAFLLVSLVIGPPVVCLGMLLPLTWQGTGAEERAGQEMGRLVAANAIVSAIGASVTSFVILPELGLWRSFALVAATYFAMSLVFIWPAGRRRFALGGGVLFAALAFLALNRPLDSRSDAGERLVHRWQSAYGVIDIVQNEDSGSLQVLQNLHYRFGQTESAVRAFRQAHIPLLLHKRPTDVFVMGLGTGLTAAGATDHSEVESVVAVELIPEVVEAARSLAEYNNGVVDHPKVEIRVDDARHSLLASDRRFDVIVSDLFVPWESETGYLYTVEHYRVARQRLKPGGLFCQWLPLYQLGEREFELIADSFASVFPTTTVWWGNIDPARPIIALIGSESQIDVDTVQLAARVTPLARTPQFRDEYLNTSQTFCSLYMGDWNVRNPDILNTDEHPRVEFLTPISQSDGRLLHDSTLHEYFDDVLGCLPSRNVKFHYSSGQTPATAAQRRAGNRFILFGE